MRFLHDSSGAHIANEIDGQLHSPTGENIGHYMPDENIFIDMDGAYLGEIVQDNRLMHNPASPYKGNNYGALGNWGNVGNYGDPGNIGSTWVDGFVDISQR